MKKQLSVDKFRSRSDRIFDVVNNTVMFLALMVVLYPLYFIVIASVSEPNLVNAGKVVLYPRGFTLGGYERIFSIPKIWIGYRNTILYTTLGTSISLVCTLSGGYALSRRAMPARNFFMAMCTFTMFFSGGMIPSYLLVERLGMLDTIWAMTLPAAVSVWNLIIARTFFQSTITSELEEAAALDGCGQLRFFFAIALPLTKALIAILTLYYMVGIWNSYFDGLLYMKSTTRHPLQLILREILVMDQSAEMTLDVWDAIERAKLSQLIKYGVIIVSSLPLLCVYPFVQRFFIKGVMIGSIKG